jgi:DNA-binding beta-propeller fold protein YncE
MKTITVKKSLPPLLFAGILFLLGGCDIGTNPEDTRDHEHDAEAWLWAFDEDNGTVTIYDTHEGVAETTYTASAFPMMHCFTAGPAMTPTLWMAKTSTVYGFTTGFDLSHGDHAHKETPETYATISVGNNPVHMGSTPSGDTIAFSNDGDQTVSIIDVAAKSVVATITHGSGHSAALLTGDYLITHAATGSGDTWAKVIDIAKDSVLDSLTIGSGAHGDSYYEAGKKAFFACTDGLYIIDVANRTVKGSIAYTEPGRTNFLYHGHGKSLAVGLHKTDAGTSDKLLLLDMQNETLEYITMSGAVVPWNISTDQFSLSADGSVAVISDNTASKIYHVTLATKTVKTLTAPAAGCAVATNADGSIVWALNGRTVSMIHAEENDVEDTFSVSAETDWIYVTSTDAEVLH